MRLLPFVVLLIVAAYLIRRFELFSRLSGRSIRRDVRLAAQVAIETDFGVRSLPEGEPRKQDVDALTRKLDKAEQFVSSIGDRRSRRAYRFWIGRHRKEVAAARKEMTTHAKRDQAVRDRRRDQERAAMVAKALRTLPRMRSDKVAASSPQPQAAESEHPAEMPEIKRSIAEFYGR